MPSKEAVREHNRLYYAANAEHLCARRRERYWADPEAARAKALAWAHANPERHRENAREWCRANPHRHAEHVDRRRARIAGAPRIEKIDRYAIYVRDDGICHLCGQLVYIGVFTLDHVVPLTRGGDHTADNLRVAHHACNARKGNRL